MPSDRAAELVAQLRADPVLAAWVLRQVRVAVRRGQCVRVAGPHGAFLGRVYLANSGEWVWYLSWLVDLDQRRGVVATEAEAWAALTAALDGLGWAVVLDEREVSP